MARHQKDGRTEEIYCTIEEYPGKRPGFIARILGVSRSMVTRALPALEEKGLFITEDDKGGLWQYHQEK